MPKRVPVEEKRVALNCLVSPATRDMFKRMDCSQGEAVDRWAAMWQAAQERQRVIGISGRMTSEEFLQGKEPPLLPPEISNEYRRPFKPPLLKPSEKRK